MVINILKEWLIPLSTFVGIISVIITSWMAFRAYRLKVIKNEIELLTFFTKLMNIAHARGGYSISETAIQELFKSKAIKEEDFANLGVLNRKLQDVAILTHPVGSAAQQAAIEMIKILGERHEILKKPANKSLEELRKFIPNI